MSKRLNKMNEDDFIDDYDVNDDEEAADLTHTRKGKGKGSTKASSKSAHTSGGVITDPSLFSDSSEGGQYNSLDNLESLSLGKKSKVCH